MKILRTPEARFADLSGYPFSPNYIRIADRAGDELRVHYVDAGAPSANPVLLMH